MTTARAAAGSRRVLHRYRRMILLGRASLPLEVARRLVGPDCAYHLYFRHRPAPVDRGASRPPSRRSRRRRQTRPGR